VLLNKEEDRTVTHSPPEYINRSCDTKSLIDTYLSIFSSSASIRGPIALHCSIVGKRREEVNRYIMCSTMYNLYEQKDFVKCNIGFNDLVILIIAL